MKKIEITDALQQTLIDLSKDRKIFLEGNICKIIDYEEGSDFGNYIEESIEIDKGKRRQRLEVTKDIQKKNIELVKKHDENDSLMKDLKVALSDAESAKEQALGDLDIMHKKTQFKLIGKIVHVALIIIISVGVVTTMLYAYAILYSSPETTLIGNTWSNVLGILLTNSFSIVGTIMGVKYASESKSD